MVNRHSEFQPNLLRKEVKNTIKLILAMLVVAVLAACGGGGGDNSSTSASKLYGAIAFGNNSLRAGVVGGQSSKEIANSLALNDCGSNCSVVANFEGQQCAGTSYSTAPGLKVYGIGNSQEEADTNAVLKCISSGGNYCSISRGACNVNTESLGTLGGVCTGSGTTFLCQGRVCTKSGDGVICSDGQYCPIPQNLSVTSNPVCSSRN